MSEMENSTEAEKANENSTNGMNAEETSAKPSEQEAPKGPNLQEELDKAKQEVASLKDSWARERAEFQNYKRRSAAEYQTIKRDAVKNFICKLLTPLDNLERVGSSSSSEELKPFIEGVQMIVREFQGLLFKENVNKLDPKGQPFDPYSMEAIASVESDEFKEETVVEVYQPGYQMVDNNEKFLLRPARVRIGKPKI